MAYGVFAEFYDGLTANVDYKAKADYLCEIFICYIDGIMNNIL